jgi:hypothetical protein
MQIVAGLNYQLKVVEEFSICKVRTHVPLYWNRSQELNFVTEEVHKDDNLTEEEFWAHF